MRRWPFSKEQRPIVGVVHLRPLPGSPGWSGDWEAVLQAAVHDAEVLATAGVDGLIVENFGDVPFYADRVPPITVAAMARAVGEVRATVGEALPIGVNVLRNDAMAALAVAAAAGAQFIRVNVHSGAMVADQGVLEGRAAETIRERERWAPGVAVWADVWVKHAVPLGAGTDLADTAAETAFRGLADALIVTGPATGRPADLTDVRRVRAAVGGAVPVLVGSGVTPETVAAVLAEADGAIVGTAFKVGGRTTAPVDPERVRSLLVQARAAVGRSRE